MGGQTIVSLKYIDYAVSKKSPAAFLSNNIIGYDVVLALNSMLDKNDRVLLIDRPWLYRLQVPYFYAHPDLQSEITLHKKSKDPALFLTQLKNKLITHVVALPSNINTPDKDSPLQKFMKMLHAKACTRIIHQLTVPAWESRTLKLSNERTQTFLIYEMTPDTCDLN